MNLAGRPLAAATAAALSEVGPGFEIDAAHGAVLMPSDARTSSSALHLVGRRLYAREEALAELARCSGSQLDPEVVQVLTIAITAGDADVDASAADVNGASGDLSSLARRPELRADAVR